MTKACALWRVAVAATLIASITLLVRCTDTTKAVTDHPDYRGNYEAGKSYTLKRDVLICHAGSGWPAEVPRCRLWKPNPKHRRVQEGYLPPSVEAYRKDPEAYQYTLGIATAGTRLTYQKSVHQVHESFAEGCFAYAVAQIVDGPHAGLHVDVRDISLRRQDRDSILDVDPEWLEASTASPNHPAPTSRKAIKRIGVYDSRAIAVAFAGSEIFNKWMSALREEHKKAKAAGDQERVAELEAEGAERQKLMHKQGFSTAPVDNILEQIEDRLPAIKQEAGVGGLVSKWDKDTLAKRPFAERVDVTMEMIDAFNPNDRQRKSAIEIQKHKPISLNQAENIRD